MILGFRKREFFVVLFTLLGVSLATFVNLQESFRKSRDAQRKGDLRTISNALVSYQTDYSSFPQSEDGLIVACFGGVDENEVPQQRKCMWGIDSLRDIFDESYPPYMETLPSDPYQDDGQMYIYLSNGRHFQIFTSLEGRGEPEYDPVVVSRGLSCGSEICNYGLSDGSTPLEMSVEEYENELRLKKLMQMSVDDEEQ